MGTISSDVIISRLNDFRKNLHLKVEVLNSKLPKIAEQVKYCASHQNEGVVVRDASGRPTGTQQRLINPNSEEGLARQVVALTTWANTLQEMATFQARIIYANAILTNMQNAGDNLNVFKKLVLEGHRFLEAEGA